MWVGRVGAGGRATAGVIQGRDHSMQHISQHTLPFLTPPRAAPHTPHTSHLVRLHHEQHLAEGARPLAQHFVGGHGDDGGQAAVRG